MDSVYKFREENGCERCKSCICVKRVVYIVKLETKPRSYLYKLEFVCKAGHKRQAEFRANKLYEDEKFTASVLAEFDRETIFGC